ncbi:MAG TPA: DUF2795 domain-containing protein [Acidimicrobiia bacterium]|jgi:hypothetical protein|nr:DUF2795 domain-containing protein [Acidimicrobiia bacterium]
MERQSNLHGRRLDDELEREVQSITRGAPVEARIEEGRAMEDAGDGEPVPQSLVAETADAEGGDELDGGLSRGELVARSDLGIHLRPGIFPAGRTEILACAAEEHASLELLGQLEALPDREYDTVQDVWEGLGGRREERDHGVPAPAAAPAAPMQTAPVTPDRRFPFRFDPWYRLAALPFAVAPASAHVDVTTTADGGRVLSARFGPWCVTTPVDNVADTAVTGPYSLLKTAGPAHVSLIDFGLTFATNGARGLCIRFRRSVPGVAPTGRLRHPALTVTVDDVEGLARALMST